MKRYIIKDAAIEEVSSCQRPAQALALATILKSEDGMAKMLFAEALQRLQVAEECYELWDKLWQTERALRDSVYSIVDDVTNYPDPVEAVKTSLAQYSARVVTLIQQTEEELSKSGDPDISQEKTDMAEEKVPNVSELQKQIADLEASRVLIRKTVAGLSADEFTYFKSLDDTERDKFITLPATERAVVVAKAADSNPIVYTTASGEVFRKNDDPRLVTMAKRADEMEKASITNAKAVARATFAKQAREVLSHLPGDDNAKADLMEAISGLEKSEEILKVLRSADAAVATMGKSVGVAKTAEGDSTDAISKLDTMAKALLSSQPTVYRDYYAAYAKVLEDNPELAQEALAE